jgi:hypothetical protein
MDGEPVPVIPSLLLQRCTPDAADGVRYVIGREESRKRLMGAVVEGL